MKIFSLEILNGLADAVDGAEGNTRVVEKRRDYPSTPGRRSWHVTHSYNTVTREVLLVAVFQESEYFKEKSRERYKIEAKNSELKHRHGYDIVSASGLFGM